MYVEQKYKGKNCTQCSQYISPTYHMMMQALKEDSKLAGHYPFKQNGKWVIPAMQTEQEQEEIISTLEKDNNGQQVYLSPAGGDVSLSADGGGIREEQETQDKNTEKDNKGQHPDSYRDEEKTKDNTSPRPNGSSVRASGAGGEQLPQDENPPQKGNNRQQPASSPWGRSGGASPSISHTDTLRMAKELHE